MRSGIHLVPYRTHPRFTLRFPKRGFLRCRGQWRCNQCDHTDAANCEQLVKFNADSDMIRRLSRRTRSTFVSAMATPAAPVDWRNCAPFDSLSRTFGVVTSSNKPNLKPLITTFHILQYYASDFPTPSLLPLPATHTHTYPSLNWNSSFLIISKWIRSGFCNDENTAAEFVC